MLFCTQIFFKNKIQTGALIHFILKEMGDNLTENLVLLEELEKIFCCMLQELKNKEFV